MSKDSSNLRTGADPLAGHRPPLEGRPVARRLPLDEVRRLGRVVQAWANPSNPLFSNALNLTISKTLYNPADVLDQLESIRRTVTPATLTRWVEAVAVSAPTSEESVEAPPPGAPSLTSKSADSASDDFPPSAIRPPLVLGLQAGNLPLAGMQDILAALLAGCRYLGKRSRRDPWLPASLLDTLAGEGFAVAGHADTIDALSRASGPDGREVDAVFFSGSAESVPQVRASLARAGLQHSGRTRELVRTARLSIAWLRGRLTEPTADALIRSILVHDNRGCRSTAVIVSPEPLEKAAPVLRAAAERFLQGRGLRPVEGERLLLEHACDAALGIEVLDLGRALLTCREGLPEQPGVVHWVRGGAAELVEYAQMAGDGLQSIHVAGGEASSGAEQGGGPHGKTPSPPAPPASAHGPATPRPGGFQPLAAPPALPESPPIPTGLPGWLEPRVEPLARAQSPPITWRPDGVDPLQWLLRAFPPVG